MNGIHRSRLLRELEEQKSSPRERMKELRCLYAVERALGASEGRLDAALRDVVQALPAGFQLPDRMAARVRLDDRHYTTSGFQGSDRSLSCPVVVDGQGVGEVEVSWTDEPPGAEALFLPEERELLALIAARLGEAWKSRNQAEQLQLLGTALHSAANAVVITDREGEIVWVNRAFTTISGYTSEEAVGRAPGELLESGVQDEDFYREFWKTIAGGKVWRGAIVNRRKDGTLYQEEQTVTPVRDGSGGITHFIAVKVDVSDQVRLESKQRRLLSIIESTPELVGIADREGGVLYINRGGRRLLGYGPDEEVEGKSIAGLHPQWAAERIRDEGIPHAIATGSWSGETALLGPGGEEIPAWQVILAHLSPDGDLEYLSTMARDLHEQKELQEQLLQAQKMEAVGRLAGGVAHDFNNLLTVIRGHTAMVMEELPAGSRHSEDLRQVLEEVGRAGQLTRQLLAFSRKQVMVAKPVALGEAVAGMKLMLRRLLPERIELHFDVEPRPVSVWADPGQLHQVLLNLAVNAGDAITGNGAITFAVTTRQLSRPEMNEISWRIEPGTFAQLRVQDTGSGMPAEVLERIFEPFFTTKPEGRGTGLGLSMVMGIIKQSKGHILVESVPGQGTTFLLLFPLLEEEDTGEAEGEVPPEAAGEGSRRPRGGHTVLLVEDTPAVQRVAARVLERAGYTVLLASNGHEALDMSARRRDEIDLIISDVVMPGLGGAELLDRLREIVPDLPIVLMSGYSEDELKDGVRHRATVFLEKPFSPEELIRVVRETLEPGSAPAA